jgi:hypothetical protein
LLFDFAFGRKLPARRQSSFCAPIAIEGWLDAAQRCGNGRTNPAAVSDALFRENPFFDSKDLLQVRYEMLRRHRVEGASIVDVSSGFGVSRPTFYQAQTAFQRGGLSALVPKQRAAGVITMPRIRLLNACAAPYDFGGTCCMDRTNSKMS